ncbi:MAG TPA: carbon-nitrogen hydrolase family protein [Polyangiaceae bacterium]
MTPPKAADSSQKRRLDVAVVQLSSQGDVSENLAQCEHWVAAAAAKGAELVVLPENFAFFGDETERAAHAESLSDPNGPILKKLSGLAQRHRVHLVAGGMPERSGDPARPFNTNVAFDKTGALAASYRKIHLFDVDLADGASYKESSSTTAGVAPAVVTVAGFGVGLSICYDLRFPELYRTLAATGAELLLVPAAFTLHTGKDHWHVLLRARAIESQCYVAAAAQWGKHPLGRTTYGHALIVDPWGTVIAEAPDGPGFALATIDGARLQSVRESLPSLRHRRM